MALGKQVRRLREKLGWTLEKLHDASGVPIGTISAIEVRGSSKSIYAPQLAAAFGVPIELLVTGTEADIDAWLASRERASDPRVIDVQAREVPQPGERAALPPLGAGVMTIREALPVVLEAMRACPHREELRTLLTLLIDIDAEPYRKRLAELLDTQAVPRPPVQTKRREDAAQEDSPHANIVVGRPTGAR